MTNIDVLNTAGGVQTRSNNAYSVLVDQNCTLVPETKLYTVADSLQIDIDNSISGYFYGNPIMRVNSDRYDFSSGYNSRSALIILGLSPLYTYEVQFTIREKVDGGGSSVFPSNVKNYYDTNHDLVYSYTNLYLSRDVGGSDLYIRFRLNERNIRDNLRLVVY